MNGPHVEVHVTVLGTRPFCRMTGSLPMNTDVCILTDEQHCTGVVPRVLHEANNYCSPRHTNFLLAVQCRRQVHLHIY
jgi:hypothetical protein